MAGRAGLERAKIRLKIWPRDSLHLPPENLRVKRFELLHKSGLSQSPLPLGYTRRMIRDFGLMLADCSQSKIQIPKSQIKMVDRKGFKPLQEVCRTSMLSITSPTRKTGADGEIWTHINCFLRAVPLPFRPRRREKLVWAAGFKPANTCFQNKPVSSSAERSEKFVCETRTSVKTNS